MPHHEQPFGRVGPATVAKIRVPCWVHDELAERDYGSAFCSGASSVHAVVKSSSCSSPKRRMMCSP